MRTELKRCMGDSKKKLVKQSFGFGFGALMLALTIWRFWEENSFLFWSIEALILILSLYHLVQYNNIRKEYKEVTRLLETEKNRIVWVYTFETEVMPYGFSMFKKIDFCFAQEDGRIEMLTFLADLKYLFLRLLKEELPHATFGHSIENEQLYKVDPEILRL